jgi:hypothetical protein
VFQYCTVFRIEVVSTYKSTQHYDPEDPNATINMVILQNFEFISDKFSMITVCTGGNYAQELIIYLCNY